MIKSFEEYIEKEKTKEYFINLEKFLKEEEKTKIIFPKKEDRFNSMKYTSLDKVKVVILGQDPYHGEGEAHGVCFSVNKGIKIPPSLRNIYKEIKEEYGYNLPNHGYLKKWADQGILLLNTVLTVEKDKPLSHNKKGWETFTDGVIKLLNEREEPIIFVLWGNKAKVKEELITNDRHYILKSPHPSPFAARHGFFGNGHFKEINRILKENNLEEINWEIK